MSEQDELPPPERDRNQGFGPMEWGVILVNGEMYALELGGEEIRRTVWEMETTPWRHEFEDPDITVRSLEWARKHQPPIENSHCRKQWERLS